MGQVSQRRFTTVYVHYYTLVHLIKHHLAPHAERRGQVA